jgi:16S rRNA (cytidine1402-2'-O)-methyltransferase
MKRHFNYQNELPSLYLIPTPIGNLDDITLRALKLLEAVDVLYAEDTRVTKKLLNYFNIQKHLFSFHEHNEDIKLEEILKKLEDGNSVGLVSDAGMPLVSDPGFNLVNKVLEKGYNVVSLPGANALLTGLVMSGIKTHPFVFLGFLDSKVNKRKVELERVKYYPETLVFYEAIHRIKSVLKSMYEVFGNRDFVIAREITKAYEEVIKGKLSEHGELEELKGELVIIVSGYVDNLKSDLSIVEQVDFFIDSGLSKTEAMKKVSQMTFIPKNKIYEEYLSSKIKGDE